MAYTAYSQAWLEDTTTVKGILIEVTVRDVVAASEITMYLSNVGYITGDSLVSYLPIVSKGVSFTETLPIDGSPTLSFGDIEILNMNGELDSWLDSTKYIWANRYIKIYLGDPFFVCANIAAVRSNFELIFSGMVADVDSKDRTTINIKLADGLSRLVAPVTTTKLGTYGSWGTTQTNQDTILPLVLGEVFNISPLLVDPSVQEYQVNVGNTESIIEIRDNGVPIYTASSIGTTAALLIAEPSSVTTITTVGNLQTAGGTLTAVYGGSIIIGISGVASTTTSNLVSIPTLPKVVVLLGNISTGIVGNTITKSGTTSATYSSAFNTSYNGRGTLQSFNGTSEGVFTSSLGGWINIGISGNTATTSVSSSAPGIGNISSAILIGNTSKTYSGNISTLNTEAVIPSAIILTGVSSISYNGSIANTSNSPSVVGTNSGPTGCTVTLGTGKFRTVNPIQGILTASVQGIKNSINLANGSLISGTYNNNIGNLIALLATQYGVGKLAANELDLTNLSAFSTANIQSAGLLINDSTTVLAACQQLANSIGAQVYMNRKGLLQLLRIGVATSDTVVNITENDFYVHTFSISNRTTVGASYTLTYCKNWTVEPNLITSIYPEDKTSFATDIYTKTSLDASVQSLYKLPAEDLTQKETLLLVASEASAEAARLNNFYKVPRTVYSFQGTFKLLSLKLGQAVTLTHSRFGLSAGVSGQVVTLSPDWINGKIAIEVLV